MSFLRMGDESYYGLNGLRVNYETAEGSYELAVENGEGPRAELMLALCNDRLYSDQEKQILRLLKKAEKGGDEYAKKWLETGERTEPPALWGVKTADVITETPPDDSVEELCKLAQDCFDAYSSANENGRPRDAKRNLIKARYYADLAAEEDAKTADIFDAPIFGTEAEQIRERAERLLWQYEDDGDEPDDKAAANALRHYESAEGKPDADDEDEYDEEQQFTWVAEYLRDGQPEEAYELLYQMAAVHGSAAGAYELAMSYYDGIGTERNYTETLRWLDIAAARGFQAAAKVIEDLPDEIKSQAAYELGDEHKERSGVENMQEAVRWFTMSAEAGFPFAMIKLGIMYVEGSGVPCDREQGRYWFERTMKTENKKCMEIAAETLDAMDADETNQKAAETNLKALRILERANKLSNSGEYAKAFTLMHEALELAVSPETKGIAEWFIACMYGNGTGVAKNIEQAYDWARRAADNGNEDAIKKLGDLFDLDDI